MSQCDCFNHMGTITYRFSFKILEFSSSIIHKHVNRCNSNANQKVCLHILFEHAKSKNPNQWLWKKKHNLQQIWILDSCSLLQLLDKQGFYSYRNLFSHAKCWNYAHVSGLQNNRILKQLPLCSLGRGMHKITALAPTHISLPCFRHCFICKYSVKSGFCFWKAS